jgi:membrane-associated phospholipid phosphatase
MTLLLAGVVALWKIGGGLPMNAYPPPNYVSGAVYGFVSHPIYVGFVFICAGCSIVAGSASGLWLTTPVVAMASAALVMGYELPDMRKRFGSIVSGDRFLPTDESSVPSRRERIRCLVTTLFSWLVLYEGVVHRGIPADAVIAYLPFERHLPVLQLTEIFYISLYPAVFLAFLAVSTRGTLRLLCIRALVSMALVIPIFLSVPLISPPRPFIPASFLGSLLTWERALDSAAAAFPSYHVIWAFLVAEAMGGGIRWRRILWRTWAVLVSVSCVTTGMHALIDVVAGLLLVVFLLHVERAWLRLRDGTQWIANSWKEWRIGPLRIINHGGFAAAGVFVGILLIEACLGSEKRAIPIAIFVGGTVGAAIWAQIVEGSPALLRPLGFYGGVLGTNLGAILTTTWTHTNPWLALSALAVAAPWIQGIGRLRCLVQGCCHGAPTTPAIGICYTHPRSRVWRVLELRGVPIHATPLYSLLLEWDDGSSGRPSLSSAGERGHDWWPLSHPLRSRKVRRGGLSGRATNSGDRGATSLPMVRNRNNCGGSRCDNRHRRSSSSPAEVRGLFTTTCADVRAGCMVRHGRRFPGVESTICAPDLTPRPI